MVDDCVQDASMRLLAKLVDGVVAPGNEEAYGRAVARAVSVDHGRRETRWGRFADASTTASDVDAPPGWERQPSHDPSAEEHAITAQDLARAQALLGRLAAPYRAVLIEVYFRERTIEDLVADEVRRREEKQGRALVAAEQTRARNSVDQLLSRARRALQEQMADDESQRRN